MRPSLKMFKVLEAWNKRRDSQNNSVSWVDPKCDVNRLHATNWPVSGITRRLHKNQNCSFLTQQWGKWPHKKRHHGPRVWKKLYTDTPSRGYTIPSTSSIVVLCLCPMQMLSQDFGPHCCTNPMRWQSVENRVEVSWIDPIALVLHWYQYLDWYAYFYGLPQWNDFDKGRHTSWRHYWHIVTNCHTVVLMYYFIIIKQIAFVFW